MLQVTDDLIRNVVQEVLGHMKGNGASPGVRYSEPLGSGAGNTWGVFDSVDDAAGAAVEAQRKFEAMGLDARRKAVACVRKICIDKAEMLGREEFDETKIGRLKHKILEFDETKIGRLKHKIEKLIVAGEKTP